MIKEQQSLLEEKQIDTGNQDKSPEPECAIPFINDQDQQQNKEDTLTSLKMNILQVQNKIVILKKQKNKIKEHTTKHKPNPINAKVHISNSNEKSVNSNDFLGCLDYQIFSLDENINVFDVFKEIIIINSRVNIYALRKIIRITSQHLVNLKIDNCTFFESDILATVGKDPTSNNKMLRELNFTFQVASFQLPQIENIDIKLAHAINQKRESELLDQKRKIAGESTEQQQRQELSEKYQCNTECSFIDFEMKARSILESRYEKYSNQVELVNYIINGNQPDKNEIEERMNVNIIEEITNHLKLFTKYIKGSLINKSILLIKGYCLEDPIAFGIIQNLIVKNRRTIKTVIFKGTGTILYETFLKVIDIIISIKTLESVAFFDSQPQSIPSCYILLKELCSKRSFKFIVLNRSSFNLVEYKYQVCGIDKPVSSDVLFTYAVTTLKHYAFYLLDVKEKSNKIYEFTPYEYCLKDILYPYIEDYNEQEYKSKLNSMEIGLLLQRQEKYSVAFQQEIKKYQDDAIITYTDSVLENAISSNEQSQVWLENTVQRLAKHSNCYTNALAKSYMNKKIKDTQLKEAIKSKIDTTKIEFLDDNILMTNLENVFLSESSFGPSNMRFDYYGRFISLSTFCTSRNFQMRRMRNIHMSDKFSSYNKGENFSTEVGEKLAAEYEKGRTIGIQLELSTDMISLVLFSQSNEEISQDTLFEFEEPKDELFNTLDDAIKQILTQCSQKQLWLSLLILLDKQHFNREFFVKLMSQLEQKQDIIIKELEISTNEQTQIVLFKLSDISTSLNIQQLTLLNVENALDLSENQSNTNEQANAVSSIFQISKFKSLTRINIKEATEQILNLVLQEASENNQDQPTNNDKQNLLQKIEEQQHCISIFVDFGNNVTNFSIQNQDLIDRILSYSDKKFKFFLKGMREEAVNLLKEREIEIYKIQPIKNLNKKLLNKFYGAEVSKYIAFDRSAKDGDQEDSYKSLIQSDEINSFERKQQQKLEQICKDVRDQYQSNDTFKQHFSYIEISKKVSTFVKKIPDCCKQLLNGDYKKKIQEESGRFDMNELLAHHYGEYCLFRTSIQQQQYEPKKIKIKFFSNILTGNAIISNNKDMEQIEELDFSENTICHYIQLKFIDFFICVSASSLKVIKFKKVFIQKDVKDETPFSFKLHQKLEKIDLFEDSLVFQQNILKALIEAKDAFHMKSINLFQSDFHLNTPTFISNYETAARAIIELHKDTLLKLCLNVFTDDLVQTVKQCTNLIDLRFRGDSEKLSGFFNQLVELQSLNSIQVTPVSNQRKFFWEYIQTFLKEQPERKRNVLKISLKWSSKSLKVEPVTFYKRINNNARDQNQIQTNSLLLLDVYDDKAGQKIQQFDENLLELNRKIIQFDPSNPPIEVMDYINMQSLDKREYSYLNQVFKVNQNYLKILSFHNCNLLNDSLNCIDFSKLPSSVRQLYLSKNEQLTSLKFLYPLIQISKRFEKRIEVNISDSRISFSDLYKLSPYLNFTGEGYQNQNTISPFNYVLQNTLEEQKYIVSNLFHRGVHNLNDPEDIDIFFKLFIHQTIQSQSSTCKAIQSLQPFVVSPLSLQSNSVNYSNALLKIFEKQKEDETFTLRDQLGNKYLLFLALYLENQNSFVLGYSKDYHENLYISVQKKFQKLHIFFDYLLILQMQRKKNVKQIHLPLTLEVSHFVLHNKRINTNIDEISMLENLSMAPPSEITIEDMSMSFIKTWYVIHSMSPLGQRTTIKNINTEAIYNTSIGNFLTQKLHRSNFFRSLLSGTPQKYRFDESVQFLAQHFQAQIQENKHSFLLCLFPLYQFFCIFGVVFFSVHYDVSCGNGISPYSYYCYLAYGVISMFIELKIFKVCLYYISHLIPSIEIDLNDNFISSITNDVKQTIIDTPWINQWLIGYSYSFFQSQIARFDNFTNVGFLFSTYQCGDYTIFYIALAFMAIPFLYSVFQFFHLILKPNKKYELPTTPLDTYYIICNIIDFRAVSDILDLVSPSNTITIRGRMFNARIIGYFLRIICENMPLVIIQIYNLTKADMSSSLIISLILSLITFLSLLLSVLTITPSTLSQEDFNKLNEKKSKNKTVQQYEKRLQVFEDETFTLRFYDHLKQLRLKYLSEMQSDHITLDLANKYNINIKYFEKLFGSQSKQLEQNFD